MLEGATIKELVLANLLALIDEQAALDGFRKARRNGHWESVSIAAGTALADVESFLAKHFSGNSS